MQKSTSIQLILEQLVEKNENVYTTILNIAELYFGAYNSKKVTENLRSVQKIESAFLILNINEKTAKKYGKLNTNLKKEVNLLG